MLPSRAKALWRRDEVKDRKMGRSPGAPHLIIGVLKRIPTPLPRPAHQGDVTEKSHKDAMLLAFKPTYVLAPLHTPGWELGVQGRQPVARRSQGPRWQRRDR